MVIRLPPQKETTDDICKNKQLQNVTPNSCCPALPPFRKKKIRLLTAWEEAEDRGVSIGWSLANRSANPQSSVTCSADGVASAATATERSLLSATSTTREASVWVSVVNAPSVGVSEIVDGNEDCDSDTTVFRSSSFDGC